jgi:hypothetical protein
MFDAIGVVTGAFGRRTTRLVAGKRGVAILRHTVDS